MFFRVPLVGIMAGSAHDIPLISRAGFSIISRELFFSCNLGHISIHRMAKGAGQFFFGARLDMVATLTHPGAGVPLKAG